MKYSLPVLPQKKSFTIKKTPEIQIVASAANSNDSRNDILSSYAQIDVKIKTTNIIRQGTPNCNNPIKNR
jgi:hypothetical protein